MIAGHQRTMVSRFECSHFYMLGTTCCGDRVDTGHSYQDLHCLHFVSIFCSHPTKYNTISKFILGYNGVAPDLSYVAR